MDFLSFVSFLPHGIMRVEHWRNYGRRRGGLEKSYEGYGFDTGLVSWLSSFPLVVTLRGMGLSR